MIRHSVNILACCLLLCGVVSAQVSTSSENVPVATTSSVVEAAPAVTQSQSVLTTGTIMTVDKRDESVVSEIPSLDTKTPTASSQNDEANRLLQVLGADVYNVPVNITTPPGTALDDVLRILAERAQLNFIAAEGVVKGKVGHLRLRNVPLGVALNSLLSANNLYLIKDGANVLRIVPKDTVLGGAIYETKTRSIRLNWVPATSIKETIGTISKTAIIQVHPGTNTVFVTDVPANIDTLIDVIRQLDLPPKQVAIDSYIVEVLDSNALTKGAELKISSYDPNNYTSPARYFEVLKGVGTFSGGGVVNILGSDFDIRTALTWAEEARIAKILTNPSVVTLDNEKATIDIIKKIPYFEAQQGVGGSGTVSNSVEFEEAGIKLDVTPHITNNGFIRLNIAPEQKIKAGEVYSPGSTDSTVPIVDTRKASTNVIVKDGETVTIGGLSQLQSDRSDNGVPWLRKTPLFGRFFASGNKNFEKNNLVIFVKPQIVKSTGIPQTTSPAPRAIEDNWDLPDYFQDDSFLNRTQMTRPDDTNSCP